MVILELYQGDYQKDLVAFDSLEEGRAFVAQIPGYTLENEDGFEAEYVKPKQLPDYMEFSSTATMSLYLGFRLILKKTWTLFGKKFRIYPLKTIKWSKELQKSMLMS